MLGQYGVSRLARRASPRAAGSVVAALLLVAGCDNPAVTDAGAAPATTAAAVAPAPADPLLAFAASASPGVESVVQGQRVRVGRAYAAASGRECRELLIGSGIGERSAVVCNDPVGGWTHARPLLRGSGAGRL